MCGQAILLSVVLLMAAEWTLADDVEIKLNLTMDSNNSVTCAQTQYNLEEYQTTVLEYESFALRTKSKHIDDIKCFEYGNEINVFVNNIKHSRENVFVPMAKNEMGVLWQCKFGLFKHVNFGQKTDIIADCYIKVHVRLKEPPHTLLVNRVVLPTIRNPLVGRDQIVDRTAIYNYTEDEEVDVFCANLNNACTDIGLTYDYAAKLDDIFNTTMKQRFGAGLRIKLQAQHNGSNVTCKCHSSGNEDVIQLTFVLKRHCDNIANIKINGYRASLLFENSDVWFTKLYDINYKALRRENTNIVGYVLKDDDVQLSHQTNNCKIGQQPETNNTWMDIKLRDNQSCNLNINAFNQTNGTIVILEKIAIKISLLPDRFIDNSALAMTFSNYSIVMEMYEYKHKRLLYYEYEEDQNVTLTCSKPVEIPGAVTCIDFNGTVIGNKISYSKNLTLTSADNQTYFTCEFNQCSQGELEDDLDFSRSVKVVFRKRIQDVSSTSAPTEETTHHTADTDKPSENPEKDVHVVAGKTNEPPDQMLYIVVPIIAVLCICPIIVCVFIVIYKRRKEHMACAPRDPNYENLQCHNEYQIPAHPPQWSRNQHHEELNYHVPVDLRKDEVVYAQPVAEDPYATPIPKSLRPNKAKKEAHEPTYAELDFPSGSAQPKLSERTEYATVGEMYSKVVPKSERNKQQNLYGNHFPNSPYVNSETTEYIEPTYCQPHLLK